MTDGLCARGLKVSSLLKRMFRVPRATERHSVPSIVALCHFAACGHDEDEGRERGGAFFSQIAKEDNDFARGQNETSCRSMLANYRPRVS